jgi:hypothetical protein
MKIIPDYIPEELENLSPEDVPDTIDAVALDNKDNTTKQELHAKIIEFKGKNTYVEMVSGKTYTGKLEISFPNFYVGNSDSLALNEVKYLREV